MSVSGISSHSLFSFVAEGLQSKRHAFRSEFEQLGKDLQSGDLAAAQKDFAALRQLQAEQTAGTADASVDPLQAALKKFAEDSQAGGINAAQKDYADVLHVYQSQSSPVHPHSVRSSGNNNAIQQSIAELGQALQAGNLKAAQQAYRALQQEFPTFANWTSETSSNATSGVSLSA
jgi:hypothetical protein